MIVLLIGHGRMGKLIENGLNENPDHRVAAVVDIDNAEQLDSMGKIADLIIDFSHPDMMNRLISYAERTKTPLVSGTTGLSEDQMKRLKALGETVPVLVSSNFSYGVAVFRHVLAQISPIFDGCDVELTETHHNKKIDAPSGTAKLLLSAIDPENRFEKIYGREGCCGARSKKEIGVHAIRGGTVAGEHTVGFYGTDEIFELTHKAGSRQIFADGAIHAAETLLTFEPGFYSMEEILFPA